MNYTINVINETPIDFGLMNMSNPQAVTEEEGFVSVASV